MLKKKKEKKYKLPKQRKSNKNEEWGNFQTYYHSCNRQIGEESTIEVVKM